MTRLNLGEKPPSPPLLRLRRGRPLELLTDAVIRWCPLGPKGPMPLLVVHNLKLDLCPLAADRIRWNLIHRRRKMLLLLEPHIARGF